MKIIQKEEYVLLTSNEVIFDVFFTDFEKNHEKLKKNNIIIQLSNNLNVDVNNILLFLKYAEIHKRTKSTFIVVLKNVNADDFPETLNIAPTLQEAEDILEMENIERDLGF